MSFQVNHEACLNLAERCTLLLLAVREEVADPGSDVDEELRIPMARLVQSVSFIFISYMS